MILTIKRIGDKKQLIDNRRIKDKMILTRKILNENKEK
ncbi:hypothetical protein RV04_GL001245 [Enterococcus hermanniensis]|uniref:Uncharacterized protein n=1 Tax=Enterococcus hermanniensis TaxID=249189 RepID=A0A1L8TP24_9ENTE|nr:hypothetical protein RV04_GL001245 [Enterococcus hermanniensis]